MSVRSVLTRFRFPYCFKRPKMILALPKKASRKFQLVFIGAACDFSEDNKSKILKEEFSHNFLTKQASVALVNSATTVLSILTSAMIDAKDKYIQVMEEMLSLFETKNMTVLEENFWEKLVELRADIKECKQTWMAVETQMNSIANVMNAVAEMAFNAGAEYFGIAANERLISAQQQLQQASEIIHQMEAQILQVQAEEIVNEQNIT